MINFKLLSKFLLFLLVVIVGISHLSPQWAYPSNAFSIALSLVVLCIASSLLFYKYTASFKTTLNLTPLLLYIVFIIVALFSTFMAPYPAAGYYKMATFTQGLLALLIVYFNSLILLTPVEREEKDVSILYLFHYFFICLGTLLAIYGIYQYFWGFKESLELLDKTLGNDLQNVDSITTGVLYALRNKRIVGTFGNPNLLCAFFAISVPFIIFAFFSTRKFILRLLVGFVLSLMLFAVYLTSSRAGLLSVILTLLLSLLSIGFKRILAAKRDILVVLGIFLIITIPLYIFSNKFSNEPVPSNEGAAAHLQMKKGDLLHRLTNITTVNERINYLKTGWQIFKQAPILGNGFDGYALNYSKYKLPLAVESRFAHNFIMEFLCEIGIVGTLLFIIFIILIFYNAYKNIMAADFGERELLYYPFFISAFIFLVNGLMEFSFFFREFYLDFILVVGVLWVSDVFNKENKPLNINNRKKYFIILVIAFSTIIIYKTGLLPSKAENKATIGDEYINNFQSSKQPEDILNAYNEYERAVSLQPNDALYNARMSHILMDLNQQQEALRYMEKAVRLNPLSASLHNELAALYFKRGNIIDAEKEQLKAIDRYPLKAAYHFNLAKLYITLGKSEEAKKELMIALKIEPENKVFKQEYTNNFGGKR